MSTLARRTLRTTAAAAGMAALGAAGLSGTAAAAPAPALPTPPSPLGTTTQLVPVQPATSAANRIVEIPHALPTVPSSVSDLPTLFVFEAPTITTAARSGDTVNGRTSRPAPVRVENDTPDLAPPAAPPQLAHQIAALSRFDTGDLLAGVPVAGDLPLQFVHR